MSKKEMTAPTIVLVCICLVASLLLAATYQVTKPLIEQITIENANKARQEVMPEASGFTAVEGIDLVAGVTEVYKSDNDTGYVITTSTKGFGGAITVMTAINPDGSILKVKVTDASNETPGLGSKATLPDYTDRYTGKSEIQNTDKAATDTFVQNVTGASYSSKGVFGGVSAALEQFAMIGGGN